MRGFVGRLRGFGVGGGRGGFALIQPTPAASPSPPHTPQREGSLAPTAARASDWGGVAAGQAEKEEEDHACDPCLSHRTVMVAAALPSHPASSPSIVLVRAPYLGHVTSPSPSPSPSPTPYLSPYPYPDHAPALSHDPLLLLLLLLLLAPSPSPAGLGPPANKDLPSKYSHARHNQ